MNKDEEIKQLMGEEALELWLCGKDRWNIWVEQHPKAEISFQDADFAERRNTNSNVIDFSGFNFPEGLVTFSNAKFGDNNVLFNNVDFGNGDVNFIGAKFGKGTIQFGQCKFGQGYVQFCGANFNDGNVFFNKTNFGHGYVSFADAVFGEGKVDFNDAKVESGAISFLRTTFGSGKVTFVRFGFGNDFVDFKNSIFEEGDVYFEAAMFGNSNVRFLNTNFGTGNVYFSSVILGSGEFCFERAVFKGHAVFSNMLKINEVKAVSFKGAIFEKTLDLSGNRMKCVPDLLETKITNPISLDGFSCELNYVNHWCLFRKVEDPRDIARLRRLKETAENNKDHERALEFHAQEMRAKRWNENRSILWLTLDWLFYRVSNYGRSIFTPIVCLLVVWLWFSSFYFIESKCVDMSPKKQFLEALLFSGGQMLPFIPDSKNVRADGMISLFGGDMAPVLHASAFIQSFFSLILFFLIGLALRNRFRI